MGVSIRDYLLHLPSPTKSPHKILNLKKLRNFRRNIHGKLRKTFQSIVHAFVLPTSPFALFCTFFEPPKILSDVHTYKQSSLLSPFPVHILEPLVCHPLENSK